MSRRGAVPVVMYHRVGPEIDDWAWSNSLTIPAATFEDHLSWLRKSGYYTATLEELYAHMRGEQPLPARSVVLTFDDGYVDNWTYVVPLLARYGLKGSVAVVPDFVDPRDVVRPTLEDVWAGRIAENELELRAFMSWSELKAAHDRGVLSAISHSMTHTWFASGPRVIDFHHPGGGYYWLDWNHAPKQKPFYLQHPNESNVPWGTPVYENGRALETSRYFPDPSESEYLVEFVRAKGGAQFFEDGGWRRILRGMLDEYRSSPSPAPMESSEERSHRYESELRDSQRVMEEKLGAPVRHFLWPGQVFTDEAMQLARTIYDSLDWSHGEAALRRFNQPGEEDPAIFRRVGVPDILLPGRLHYPGGRYLIECLEEFRGVPLARKRRQAMKLFGLLRLRLGASA